jgi:hypothetical protein
MEYKKLTIPGLPGINIRKDDIERRYIVLMEDLNKWIKQHQWVSEAETQDHLITEGYKPYEKDPKLGYFKPYPSEEDGKIKMLSVVEPIPKNSIKDIDERMGIWHQKTIQDELDLLNQIDLQELAAMKAACLPLSVAEPVVTPPVGNSVLNPPSSVVEPIPKNSIKDIDERMGIWHQETLQDELDVLNQIDLQELAAMKAACLPPSNPALRDKKEEVDLIHKEDAGITPVVEPEDPTVLETTPIKQESEFLSTTPIAEPALIPSPLGVESVVKPPPLVVKRTKKIGTIKKTVTKIPDPESDNVSSDNLTDPFEYHPLIKDVIELVKVNFRSFPDSSLGDYSEFCMIPDSDKKKLLDKVFTNVGIPEPLSQNVIKKDRPDLRHYKPPPDRGGGRVVSSSPQTVNPLPPVVASTKKKGTVKNTAIKTFRVPHVFERLKIMGYADYEKKGNKYMKKISLISGNLNENLSSMDRRVLRGIQILAREQDVDIKSCKNAVEQNIPHKAKIIFTLNDLCRVCLVNKRNRRTTTEYASHETKILKRSLFNLKINIKIQFEVSSDGFKSESNETSLLPWVQDEKRIYHVMPNPVLLFLLDDAQFYYTYASMSMYKELGTYSTGSVMSAVNLLDWLTASSLQAIKHKEGKITIHYLKLAELIGLQSMIEQRFFYKTRNCINKILFKFKQLGLIEKFSGVTLKNEILEVRLAAKNWSKN